MEHTLETALAVDSLRAPLNPAPATNQENFLNQLRVRYRCYFVEYCVSQGAVMLPRLFSDDFGHDVTRVAVLEDADHNQFQCLVEKIHGNVYLTRGWGALRHFYNIRLGAWLMLIYQGAGRFALTIHDRFQDVFDPVVFTPPARFVIDMDNVPLGFETEVPEFIDQLAYLHDDACFHFSYQKTLTSHDVSAGYLELPEDDFGRYAFEEDTTAVLLVDDCGNVWNCDLIYMPVPTKHYRVSGQWSVVAAARRLKAGGVIIVGSKPTGHGHTIYVTFNP